MSHHHDHDHDHDHQHGQDHHHGHAHSHAPLSFSEKLVKLLDHWIQHNDQHAEDYPQMGPGRPGKRPDRQWPIFWTQRRN